MPKMTVDGIEIEVPAGITVLQACEMAGKEIPRFCYHERLSVAGNCRMCLVEQEKAPKPIASCAMPVAEGMVIKTDTPLVKKARNGVMEFLLINHPLDCPICDQGGECDLQDQAVGYGRGFSRYAEEKRAVTDKEFGPLVKTVMTRCIQCTRCIRFATEIAGTEVLGGTSRGEHLEITTYVEKTLDSELSGNLIDVCPVGALTSKPYAFTARPWELLKTDSVDVSDATGTLTRLDTRGREVLRVLPRLNEDVNEEWMADKGRFNVDGLLRQRLDRPYIRVDGKLKPSTWPEAFDAIAAKLNGLAPSKVAAIAGDLCDAELMFALKELMTSLGSGNLDCRQDGAANDPKVRASYLFNTTIAGIEKADAILLIGTNPRWEAPIVNARIRKRYLKGKVKIASIGPKVDLTYPVEMLGAGSDTLGQVANGSHAFAQVLKHAKAPMLIVGMGALARSDGAAILALAKAVADNCGLIKDGWNGFNVLHTAAARVGGLELGFVPQSGGRDTAGILQGAGKGEIEFVYLLGADEIDPSHFGKAFVVYQGHHGDKGAHRADVVLPGAAYTEKDGTYMNLEGRAQLAMLAIFPPGEAKEDWAILRALSERLGKPLSYDNLDQLRAKLYQANRRFQRLNAVDPAAWEAFGAKGDAQSKPFESSVANYYMTDPISRASVTMAECTEAFVSPQQKTGLMPSWFTETMGVYLGTAAFLVLMIICIILPLLLAVAYLTYAERKVMAAMQIRRGPNVVGPFGLLQPIADGVKLMFKETIIPSGASRVTFLVAPMITFVLSLIAWAVIPFSDGVVLANINVGILYLFAISSLGVYGIILAGWASNSKYPFLGALRSAAQMVSYEVSIGFVMVTVLLCVGSLNINDIVKAQHSIWFCIPLLPMFVVFFISALAETNRPPFDLPEAESELVAGYFSEYSAMTFALFFLGEYANIWLMSAMTAILFLGGWQPILGWEPFAAHSFWQGVWHFFWFSSKIAFVAFCFLWVRATFPRYRYDQLMRLGWKVFLPLSLAMVVFYSAVLVGFGLLPGQTRPSVSENVAPASTGVSQ